MIKICAFVLTVGNMGSFHLDKIPCFYCDKLVSENTAQWVKLELISGQPVTPAVSEKAMTKFKITQGWFRYRVYEQLPNGEWRWRASFRDWTTARWFAGI